MSPMIRPPIAPTGTLPSEDGDTLSAYIPPMRQLAMVSANKNRTSAADTEARIDSPGVHFSQSREAAHLVGAKVGRTMIELSDTKST